MILHYKFKNPPRKSTQFTFPFYVVYRHNLWNNEFNFLLQTSIFLSAARLVDFFQCRLDLREIVEQLLIELTSPARYQLLERKRILAELRQVYAVVYVHRPQTQLLV